MQMFMDRLMLKMPIFGDLIEKSVFARWTRTLSTMFAAGVPLVEALGLGGRRLGQLGLRHGHRQDPAGGLHRHQPDHAAMTMPTFSRTMVLQMCAIGEESGSLDHMLGKAADFYEAEVDDMVARACPA
jgi:type IV pilus assembly protein PilC